jgi:hypothetical protein
MREDIVFALTNLVRSGDAMYATILFEVQVPILKVGLSSRIKEESFLLNLNRIFLDTHKSWRYQKEFIPLFLAIVEQFDNVQIVARLHEIGFLKSMAYFFTVRPTLFSAPLELQLLQAWGKCLQFIADDGNLFTCSLFMTICNLLNKYQFHAYLNTLRRQVETKLKSVEVLTVASDLNTLIETLGAQLPSESTPLPEGPDDTSPTDEKTQGPDPTLTDAFKDFSSFDPSTVSADPTSFVSDTIQYGRAFQEQKEREVKEQEEMNGMNHGFEMGGIGQGFTMNNTNTSHTNSSMDDIA